HPLLLSAFKQYAEWGINLSRLKDLLPKGLIWRISIINILVITVTVGLSGWAVYHTACFLAGGFGNFGTLRQQQFNSTFLQYVIIFGVIGLVVGSLRSEEHTSELQSRFDLVCRLLLDKKK